MSYTVKFRELGTFHVGKDEVVETDEATLTIEGCKPDRFYSVEIQSDDGSARLQLHPILGEHGGEGDDEDQEPKPPRFSFKVVMRWAFKGGKLVSFTAKAIATVEKIEKIVRYFIDD